MKLFKNAIHWVLTQFRTHTARSLLVTIPALALVTAGILWACGEFTVYSYLPNRAYILGENERKEPQTLEEMLHLLSEPDVDTLLRNPAIAQELLSAGTLTDIVDSRLALNNLKSLDRQLSERLEEPPETMQAAALSAEGLPVVAQAALRLPADSGQGTALIPLAYKPDEISATPLSAQEALKQQATVFSNLKAATTKLLTPPVYGDLVAIPAAMNMKGLWQTPDEALVHMTPSGDWLPEQGYKLYREVNGQSELIAEQLASPARGLNGGIKVEGVEDVDPEEMNPGEYEEYEKYKGQNINLIQEMYKQAELTQDKLTSLGMSADEFRDMVYRTDTLAQRSRIPGKADFEAMQEACLTIPNGIEQRLPETDLMLGQAIYVQGRQENGIFTSAMIKASLWQKFSVSQSEPASGIRAFQTLPDGANKFLVAREVLTARQQLATLSFVDDEFAEAAGFLIRDDLSKLNLPDGAKITYRVEAPGGWKTSVSVTCGAENNLSKPQGLMGYGVDGKVPLRWDQTESGDERKIISGYLIERKLDGESGFTQISKEPVAVSYMLDETGIYCESPVFFEDAVENGRTAQYRIRSLDIFGRTSEYSDVLKVEVEKVTPPNAPAIDPPVLSDDAEGASAAVTEAVALNAGKHGIVLPVFTDSADTVRFTVYRAVAVGAKGFGAPEAIANLTYDNPMAGTSAGSGTPQAPLTIQKKLNKAKQILLANAVRSHPNLIYFDTDIQEGSTYKYWVSAWDSWNNESAWSQSASVGVPTGDAPETPGALTISMHSRELPDFSRLPPGILHEDTISFDQLDTQTDLPKRSYAADIVTATVRNAEAAGIRIGKFIGDSSTLSAGSSLPPLFDQMYDNLPEERYIHLFVAVRGEDVLPGGTARLKWPAYSGEGLAGYAVYRPAFVLKPLGEMQQMSRSELTQMGLWRRVNDTAIIQNQFVVSGLDKGPGALSLFLICLEPKEAPKLETPIKTIGSTLSPLDVASRFAESPEGGYVYINWEPSDNPQVKYYRVYRSEVPSFKEPIDEAALPWTLVGDHITAPEYTERVEQTFAHYYYYKVTSVSPWGVESAVGAVEHFRVPSTKPPQTPSLLLPLSSKDGVRVNFSAVSHCDRYEVYRTAIPKPNETQLSSLLASHPELFAALFETPSKKDVFLTGMLSASLKPGLSAVAQNAPIRGLDKFKTLAQSNNEEVIARLASLDDAKGLSAYKELLDELGPLALSDYCDLSEEMMKRVLWTKIGELPAAEQEVDPTTGLLKPLSITDTTAEYGVMYLYTVQAWNDDNLGSTRPEPVEATPRRNGPFDPISGLSGEVKQGKPHLTWNVAAMKNLTWEQCREDTVGYLVYRSDKEDGTYYQASPLLFEPQWTDEDADPFALNWYKVKVLDTGGYLSEFSEPLLVRLPFKPTLKTVIPELPSQTPEGKIIAPKLTVEGSSFSVKEGTAFRTAYGLTGTEPITVTVKASDRAGVSVPGFSVDAASHTVSAPGGLSPGVYNVTVTAKNSAGESSATFLLEVQAKEAAVVAPKLTIDGRSFSVKEGAAFETTYGLTGTEPITVTVKAGDRAGASVPGFSVDTASRTVSAPSSLSSGVYNVTVMAKNSAGESSATFLLEVQREVRTPPELSSRRDGYTFNMTRASDFKVQLSASGSEPLSWELEPVNARIAVPSEASIDDSGLLTIGGDIQVGNYSFMVKVSNDEGSDTREVQLEVEGVIVPIKPIIPIRPVKTSVTNSSGTGVVLLATLDLPSKPAQPTQPAESDSPKKHLDQIQCMGFTLTDVNFYASPLGGSGASGSAMLNIGYEALVPVSLLQAAVEQKGNQYVMTAGTVYLEEPFELQSIGVTLVSLEISPLKNKAAVGGHVKSTAENQDLIGDLYALEFTDAQLKIGNIVVKSNLPDIRYEQFTIHEIGELWIRLNGKQTGAKDFISLVNSGIAMKSHLETLNNEGLELSAGALLTFDLQGRMSGTLYTMTEQSLQLLVPGGAALRVEAASLTFIDGTAQPTGNLTGKLMVPFEQPGATGPGVPGVYAGGHPETNEMDALAAGNALSPTLKTSLYAGVLKFGKTVQQNGLLILPDDPALQDQCSYVPIEVHNWAGKGFLIESTTMTPTNVAERSLTMEKQRVQGIAVTPTAVTVDLDRENFVPIAAPAAGEKILTPKETEKPFWVGLVMKGGTVALPPKLVQKDGGGTISFGLAPGEMIYDLNGFNYQTYLYSDNPDGVPANFGDALGGFPDVWVHDCLLDLYANRVNLEINADVEVDLFLEKRVNVKLYTNQDPFEAEPGEFLCSVAKTTVENALAEGIDMKIDGGWVKPDGMHLSGAVIMQTDEVTTAEPLAFTDMVVPADIRKTIREDNPDGKYAAVELDRPTNIGFQGFTMEIRALDLTYIASRPVTDKPVWLTMYGATLLAENIPLSSDTTDALIIECPIHWLTESFKIGGSPSVVHEESYSVLDATFDDCIDISGVLIPKPASSGGDGLVEYDTDQLNLTFLKQLEELPVKAETRFGYDMEKKRSYFAAGLVPDGSGAPIHFGGGEIQNFTGMVAYNMTIGLDGQGRFKFPNNANQMAGFIDNLQVHKGDQPSFAAGIRGKMVVMGLCDIRDLYFGFESGPIVAARGDLYLPLDVGAMVGAGDYTHVGSVAIIYSHPDRYFSFSMTIEEINVAVAKVGGSLGFEYSPRLFGVYVGYPETLGGMIGVFHVGVGVGLRIDQDGTSMIQAKAEFGLERDINVSIVYLRGYVYAGADGAYYFDNDRITLVLYLKGGIEGGIKVGGKRYNIIGFYLDAQGDLESAAPYDSWQLGCSAKVSYSLDLWLVSVEGSVQASFDTRIG